MLRHLWDAPESAHVLSVPLGPLAELDPASFPDSVRSGSEGDEGKKGDSDEKPPRGGDAINAGRADPQGGVN